MCADSWYSSIICRNGLFDTVVIQIIGRAIKHEVWLGELYLKLIFYRPLWFVLKMHPAMLKFCKTSVLFVITNNCGFNRSLFLSLYIDEKLIYLNCWLKRSLKCTISQFLALSNDMKKGLNGTRTLIAAMPVQCFTSSAIRLLKSWSVCRSMSPNNDQLPVGPIAPLVEHFTGMTEFRVRALFRPEFFRPYSPLLK